MNHQSFLVTVATSVLVGMAVAPLAVDAHGGRTVGDGKFEMVVGFLDEPVYAGDKSGLDLMVTYAPQGLATPGAASHEGGGAPVVGLEETLNAEVIFGDQRLDLPLSAAWDEEGAYYSIFFPSQSGDYTFHITGEIEGVAIDESFTSSRDGFGAVRDPEPVTFPAVQDSASVSPGTTNTTISGGLAAIPVLGVAAMSGGAALFIDRRRRS